ncbi:rho/rac/cdc gtpase-activating protein [Holotrichia oblita]|uniref:Rho/rac/cdc gtpase-activating protein n=1 Tax=Holotrichia oblita TaxID=644536 RepID=A0ACB9SHA4_HOLOL|nr:rho/rac/cdc gtpase-activating protein [Holotrichia oblita]
MEDRTKTSNKHTGQDIQISAPLKLIWRGGKTETIERGAVVFKNGLLQIQNDTIKSKVEMKMNSTIKNNKICEFSSPEQTLKVSVDREHQITMGSPRQRRKSVEEESPKNFNKQNILMKLLRRRSDKQLLEKKGIFKCEDIFGNKLTVLHETLRSTIPEFVKKAVELIETEKNIKSEHIYRLSGNMATIQKIRLKIDGKNYRVLEEYRNEIDVLTGCLKLFYRELVEPLIPYRSFDELNKLTMKPPHIERDKAVKNIIKKMETPHRENLLFLIQHLLTVESYKEYNKMNIQSLSIVWGPSMLWYPGAEKCTSYSPYEFSMLVNGILELILTTYQTDPEILHQIQMKNCSTDESNESLDTLNEDNIKKSPAVSASTSSKWLFGLRKSESKDKLNGSSWSLTENKKEKLGADGYFGRSLESLPKPEGSDVPGLIMRMVQNIERYSSLRGLYCKPGSRDPVGKFKKRLQKKSDISKMDPLDMAIALLRFLQELERPLMHKSIYEDFKENFGKNDDKSRTIQVKEGIQNLSKEHQATVEFLVNHILNIFDHQDKDSRENIYNAWLPIFSNSTEINSANSTFMDTVLDIYRPKRGLPTSTLPLKTDFDFKFTTRDSTDSIDDEYMTDYDRMGLYLRTSSTVSDSTISFSSFKPRSSIEETKTGQNETTIKDVDPVETIKLNETLQKKDADTLELANKLKILMQDAKKDGDTSQKIGDNDNIVDTEKTEIESLQHRLSNLNVDTTIKKELETTRKIVDVWRKDVDSTPKLIDTVDTTKKDVDPVQKDVDTAKKDVDVIKRNVDMKKIIGTIKKDVEKTKNTGDNKFKPLIRTRAQSPSPVRLPAAFMAGKTMQKRPVRNESTVKELNRPVRTNISPISGKKLVINVDNKEKITPINLRGVVLSPVNQRKNYNKGDTGVVTR